MTSTLLATTPEGLAIQELADLIKGCAQFQEECNTEGDDERTLDDHVHYPLTREGIPSFWPFAVLTHAESSRRRFADGTTLPRGTVRLILGRRITNPDDFKGEEIRYLNFEGAVLDVIQQASGDGGRYLWEIQQLEAPSRTDPRHDAGGHASPPYYESVYACEWSVADA
jgi:hypothetical protein